MNRRDALGGLAVTAAACALGAVRPVRAADARVPLGIQFFTFVGRDGAKIGWDKYAEYLQVVRNIGFDAVELAGFSGYAPEMIRKRADELGLQIPSVHIGFDQVFPFLPPPPMSADSFAQAQDVVYSPVGVVQLARALSGPTRDVGAHFATIAGGGQLNFTSVDNVLRFADALNKANDIVKDKGLALSWHPHSPEFTPMQGGTVPFDLIVANTDPSIRYELDIYWSALGSGEAPQKTIQRFAARLALFHLKDMDSNKKIATPGAGTFDFKAVLAAARAVQNPIFFVERDGATDPTATAKEAFAYLRKLGYGQRA